MANGVVRALPQTDVCPYCGQPVTRHQLDEIRQRVREEEKRRLDALEKELRRKVAAEQQANTAVFSRRATELARRERELSQKAKLLETAAKARYEEGYRKARSEAVRVQEQLQKQLDDLKRRLERKTPDELGSVSEDELADLLRHRFPEDRIERVRRGAEGADVLQEVRHGGNLCGQIVYESKNVKQFLSSFVDRAKGFRALYETPYVVLVTTAFPAGERDFCVREGVILVHPSKVAYVTELLRGSMVEIARTSAAGSNRDAKGDQLVAYVSSDEFKERVRAVLAAVDDLRALQEEERKRHERTWGEQGEAFRTIEKFTGQVRGRLAAIVEGRA